MDFLVVLDVVSSGTRISSESIIAYFFREKSFLPFPNGMEFRETGMFV